jgi:hypothetical protein
MAFSASGSPISSISYNNEALANQLHKTKTGTRDSTVSVRVRRLKAECDKPPSCHDCLENSFSGERLFNETPRTQPSPVGVSFFLRSNFLSRSTRRRGTRRQNLRFSGVNLLAGHEEHCRRPGGK